MEKSKFHLSELDKEFVKDFGRALFCALLATALFKMLQF